MMPIESSLLERIDCGDETGVRTVGVDEHRIARSVLSHLQQLLNVRQGNACAMPEYGMPDFNDVVLRLPDAIGEIRRSLRDCLAEFEPRLTSIQVAHVPDDEDPMRLKFDITARLRVGDDRISVAYHTELGDDGRVKVRGR